MDGNVLELRLRSVDADLFGEAVERRQRQLAQAMGVKYRLVW
jgi:exopolyphosphatase/guanosine-5'-triphosphate,3'-diphosphate pyrophosphatase